MQSNVCFGPWGLGGWGVRNIHLMEKRKYSEKALRFNQQMTSLSTVICRKLPELSVPHPFDIHTLCYSVFYVTEKAFVYKCFFSNTNNSDMVTDVQFLISSNCILKNTPPFAPDLLQMMISQRNLASIPEKEWKVGKVPEFSAFRYPVLGYFPNAHNQFKKQNKTSPQKSNAITEKEKKPTFKVIFN